MGGRPVGWKRPIVERFWGYVDRRGPNECWPWIGPKSVDGYGNLTVAKRPIRATHISLAIDGRPVPAKMQACHDCDNPPCVNPAHLFIGTAKDNRVDMALKGRGWTGPRSAQHRAKQSAGLLAFHAAHPGSTDASRRTHCPQGHPYDEANTFRDRHGHRHCRACNRVRARAHYYSTR